VRYRGCTTRHAGYAISQIAEAVFTFAVAAYNLIRIPKLLAQASA
jgi:hypothetical protein